MSLEWIGIILLSVGLIVTWIRNGKHHAAEFGSMKTELTNVKDALEKQIKAYSKVEEGFAGFREHCAGQTATFDQKIKNLEGEIFSKKRKR